MQIVVFQLGEEKYAIETSKVQGIEKMANITKVPRAHQSIKGLINLRGSIISVIDPYEILGISAKERLSENIIIIDIESEILGIIVDKVAEVVEIENHHIKNVSISKGSEDLYIKGTINMGDHLVTLINIEALLNIEV
ncbi:chemotaxis protein CheW [Oxobacter pfennigii]|uniref:Chemotaxis protein CheW n=1 Tax=Oxobacter pfennigii TaxID=36849 RepID=A0A0N8NTF1_9CLOT|nr:chemotaxis protein CheW [Oxobacter pfennigii]KPU44656.1 chemotaxis protein CheW [Oxobacter pfennigii]